MVLCTLGRVWADNAAAVDYTKILPADLVKDTPKGKLVNPYKDTQADVVAAGGQFLLSYSCSGCHGGGAERGVETGRAQRGNAAHRDGEKKNDEIVGTHCLNPFGLRGGRSFDPVGSKN